ncbi:MAG: OmpA family protein [Treponema sp.]|jgi:outer membrane protein OmpA-like peptidoglycan-associated protein|nr:OmpA family protein [Treponema sp.]
MKKYYLLIILCSLFIVNLFGENNFSLRVAPVLNVPIGSAEHKQGMGADIYLDWAFWNFANNFYFGLNVGGGFASIPVVVDDPLTLLEGKAGALLLWRPLDRWAFQAGLFGGVYQYSRGGNSDTNGLFGGALGAQFHLSPYFSLYAELDYTSRALGSQPLNTIGTAVGLRFNLSEIMGGSARVQIDKTQQYRVFPVSYAWYEYNPVATVTVTNNEPNTITDVNLSFFMDSYMSQPWTFAVLPRLMPGESVEVPVTALFNDAMMNLTETINANGLIQMQYRSLGAKRNSISPIQMPIFHRNTLSWDDDRRAAAFVSPKDSAARYFARYVYGALETSPVQGNTPENVRIATALFEALRLYGIKYVVVPATSFANVSADESALDNVSYPYQALYYRGGDCSYLSILFCSMLEALDIESAFITIPGHIYIAFDVGDNDWYAFSEEIIELDGNDGTRRRWLPIEITIPDQGFTRAWRVGASQWRIANNNEQATGNSWEGARLYPIREAWDLYPSVTVTASGDHLPIMPARNEIVRAMERETGIFRWTEANAAAAEREGARRRGEEEITLALNEEMAAEIAVILEEHNVADISVEASAAGVMIRLSDIQFLADSAVLAESEKVKLQEIANVLRTLPDRKIQVAGHTAMAGSAGARVFISEQRAQAVAAYLIEIGAVSSENITAVGYGADRPIADNSTPEGMAANRRVEITISN